MTIAGALQSGLIERLSQPDPSYEIANASLFENLRESTERIQGCTGTSSHGVDFSVERHIDEDQLRSVEIQISSSNPSGGAASHWEIPWPTGNVRNVAIQLLAPALTDVKQNLLTIDSTDPRTVEEALQPLRELEEQGLLRERIAHNGSKFDPASLLERAGYATEGLSKLSRRDAFEVALNTLGVSTSAWGRGKANTVEKLLDQLDQRESALNLETREVNGEVTLTPVLRTNVARVDVFYQDAAGEQWKLREVVQYFPNGVNGEGSEEFRERNIDCSVGEKIIGTEAPYDAAVRALREELGIRWREPERLEASIASLSEAADDQDSAYPGLEQRKIFYNYDVHLTPLEHRPNGDAGVIIIPPSEGKGAREVLPAYVERSKDKSIYFSWEPTKKTEKPEVFERIAA